MFALVRTARHEAEEQAKVLTQLGQLPTNPVIFSKGFFKSATCAAEQQNFASLASSVKNNKKKPMASTPGYTFHLLSSP